MLSSILSFIAAGVACAAAQSSSITGTASEATSSLWPYQTFVSEPNLRPPIIELNKAGTTSPGHIIFSQSGSVGAEEAGLIMTDDGELLWNSDPNAPAMSTLTPFLLDGKRVLAYWTGVSINARGDDYGRVTIIDDTYRSLYNVTLTDTDLFYSGVYESLLNSHETYITSYGTFVGISYDPIPFDLSPVGGPTEGWLRDGVIYEIDIKTNKVLFKWRASEHISITRSHDPRNSIRGGFGNASDSAWDYIHLNAVSDFEDGYIVSARHTFDAIYIDRSTGNIVWRVQGEDGGDFNLDPKAVYRWQHDIRLERSNGELFMHLHDNENNYSAPFNATTGKLIRLDIEAKSATLAQIYNPDERLQASSGGSFQRLSNDNVFMYFGSQPVMKEFSNAGDIHLSYRFGPSDSPTNPGVGAYRAFKAEWKGYPTTKPAIAACKNANGTVNVYMSWNGATEVNGWSVYSGNACRQLQSVQKNIKKTHFETVTTIQSGKYVQVEALGGCRNKDETRRSVVLPVKGFCT